MSLEAVPPSRKMLCILSRSVFRFSRYRRSKRDLICRTSRTWHSHDITNLPQIRIPLRALVSGKCWRNSFFYCCWKKKIGHGASKNSALVRLHFEAPYLGNHLRYRHEVNRVLKAVHPKNIFIRKFVVFPGVVCLKEYHYLYVWTLLSGSE